MLVASEPVTSNESLINVNLSPPVQNQKVDRRRFAALFPEDADLIQGIGSLRA